MGSVLPLGGSGSELSDSGFPVFSPSGQLLGNLTGNQGQVSASGMTSGGFDLPSLPSLPSIMGGAAGSPSTTAAATAAGISGAGNPPAATTGSTTAATGAAIAQNWFARATIVILGFVFVAVGLSQFARGQQIVKATIGKIPK